MDYSDERNSEEDEMDNAIEENKEKKRWGAHGKSQDPPIVLEPDHPLMQRFQATYKQYLEKENDRLNSEILQLKIDLKKKKQEYSLQMSEEMYNLEQAVSQQRESILEYELTLDKTAKLRSEKEECVKKNREIYKEHLNKLNQEKKKEMGLFGELEALSLLCKQYESWQKDTDSELAVNQRVAEKISVEKQQLALDKKNTDMMVYKLTTEVWNLESQIELLEGQMQIKTQELENIKIRVANNTTDLQALEIEQRHLIQLWNSVIVNIQQKDKMHAEVNNEFENVQMDIKTLIAKIESIKKEIDIEMHQHETITTTKDKIAYDLAECNKCVELEEARKINIETAIMDITASLEITEKDLHLAKMENMQKTNTLKSITHQFEKLTEEKMRLENETLDKLQEQLSCDKAAKGIASRIKQLKENSRKEEISMLSSENQCAKILWKIEKQKEKYMQKTLMIEEERKLLKEKESELAMMENKLKEHIFNIERKQSGLELTNKKIAIQLEKMGGKEMSPVERKIEELEKEIDEHTKKSKQLQQDWLRMQGHVVQLTGQYQKILSEINLTNEQIQIMEYKIMKLENNINTQKQDEIAMHRSLEALQTRIDQLSKQMLEDKEHNQELQINYSNLTLESMAKLKDAEMKTMTIQEEITDLEEEKVQLAIDLRKLKREVLSWQKMGIMAVETKQKVDEEKAASGEIGRMKTEIHRMEVRQGQVSSMAARLASDLEQAVWRRAAATDRARACPQSLAPRHTFLSKIKEKRSDIRRLNQEIDINKNLIDNTIKEKDMLQKEANEKRSHLMEMENEIKELKKQVMDAQLQKQKNLERIIRYQRYGQHCTSILSGQTRIYSVKSEPGVSIEHGKQKKLNSQLVNLVQSLLKDVPEHHLTLMSILNTLNTDDDE